MIMHNKVVIDCSTGEQTVVPLTEDEVAECAARSEAHVFEVEAEMQLETARANACEAIIRLAEEGNSPEVRELAESVRLLFLEGQ